MQVSGMYFSYQGLTPVYTGLEVLTSAALAVQYDMVQEIQEQRALSGGEDNAGSLSASCLCLIHPDCRYWLPTPSATLI